MNVTTLGIDLAKSIFQLHGVDERGKVALQKRVTRSKLRETVAQLPRICRNFLLKRCSAMLFFQSWVVEECDDRLQGKPV